MANGVVKVGRRTYAVGLFWQPSPSGRVAQAARESALQPGGQQADFYCVRAASKSVSVPQYGLGQSAQGHKVGMPTLAASLANVQPGSWTGAFRLREGTWVIVVRDDLVAPDGDMLFDSDEAARERLLQEISLGGVQRIYAPDGWAIPGSDPTPLPLLLQDRTDCRLQPVHLPLKLLIYIGAGVGAVLLLIFLALQYQAQIEQQEQERLAAEARAKAGAISSMMREWEWPPVEQVYERVWEKKPLAGSAITACHEAFATLSASQLGWRRGGADCDAGTLVMTWNREAMHVAVIPEKSSVNEQGMVAMQSASGTPPGPRGAEDLYGEKDITRMVLTHDWPVTLSRLPDDPPIVKPPEHVKNPPPPPAPLWRKRGLHYSGRIPPWQLRGYLEGVPGLVITKIRWDGANWSMEATIYEKRGG